MNICSIEFVIADQD